MQKFLLLESRDVFYLAKRTDSFPCRPARYTVHAEDMHAVVQNCLLSQLSYLRQAYSHRHNSEERVAC